MADSRTRTVNITNEYGKEIPKIKEMLNKCIPHNDETMPRGHRNQLKELPMTKTRKL